MLTAILNQFLNFNFGYRVTFKYINHVSTFSSLGHVKKISARFLFNFGKKGTLELFLRGFKWCVTSGKEHDNEFLANTARVLCRREMKQPILIPLHWMICSLADPSIMQDINFKTMFIIYWIAFRADTKSYPMYWPILYATLHSLDAATRRYRSPIPYGFRELGVNMMEVMITTKQRGKCCNFSFSFSPTTNKILSNRGVFFNSTNRQLNTYFLFWYYADSILE